jgi:hypothetical protein
VPSAHERIGLGGIALQPFLDAVVVELTAPEEPRKRLALNLALVVGEVRAPDGIVERVGLGDARGESVVEISERMSW